MDTTSNIQPPVPDRPWLRRFSILLALTTLILIFMGGQVKSHEAGLAVPDWPTTYGENMFLFHPSKWVGGIFHEHTHRLVASFVGLLTVVLAFWLAAVEPRKWVKGLGWIGVAAVIAQGLLGGLTVRMMLPTWVSVSHGVLAQTFFMITILIVYTQTREWKNRESKVDTDEDRSPIVKPAMLLVGVVYVQLILGAIMRHTESGLALPDFPTMGGQWLPVFTQASVEWVNNWRTNYAFDSGVVLDDVTLSQLWFHFIHRLGALAVVIGALYVGLVAYRNRNGLGVFPKSVAAIGLLILAQVTLGIVTVLSHRVPLITSLHVVTGAATLGFSWLLALRTMPLHFWGEESSPFDEMELDRVAGQAKTGETA